MMRHVLYLENNPDDIALVRFVFGKDCRSVSLSLAHTLSSAREQLLSMSDLPCAFVLLDYNLDDGEKGIHFLRWLREHPSFRQLPVVMYSAEAYDTIQECYQEGADFFIRKTSHLNHLREFARCLDQCLASELPSLDPLRRLPHYAPKEGTVFTHPKFCLE